METDPDRRIPLESKKRLKAGSPLDGCRDIRVPLVTCKYLISPNQNQIFFVWIYFVWTLHATLPNDIGQNQQILHAHFATQATGYSHFHQEIDMIFIDTLLL